MIHFFSEEIDFSLSNKQDVIKWLGNAVEEFGKKIHLINYIFCSDDYLLRINKEYLNHDYYTDIITFDNSEAFDSLEADIFISVDRVRENAQINNKLFENELLRVIIHGMLHLLGFNDSTEEERKTMRLKEEAYLSLW